MKKFALLLTAVLALSSCRFVTINPNVAGKETINCDGPVETRTLPITEFSGSIRVNGHADVEIAQSDVFEIAVRANNEVFDHLDFHTDAQGVLVLQTKEKVHLRAETFDIMIKAPALKDVEVNGAADLNVKNYWGDEDLDIEVNGAGDIDLKGVAAPSVKIEINGAGDIKAEELDVEELSVSVNGAGDAKLAGRATNAKFRISGAGDIDARNLKTEHVDAKKSGVGSIRY